MNVYYILLFSLLLLSLLSANRYGKRYSSLLLFVGGGTLLIVAAFRDVSVGTDTLGYYLSFNNIHNEDITRVYSGTQYGWYLYNIFMHDYFNYSVFQFVNYLIIIVGFCYFIHKESQNSILSLLLFFLLCNYTTSFNIMRQYIAIGIVSIALTLMETHPKRFIVLILVASLFHFSALLCLVLFPIKKMLSIKNKKWVLITLAISFILGFFFTDALKALVSLLEVFSFLNEGVPQYTSAWGTGMARNIFSNLAINFMFILTYLLSRNKNSVYLRMYFLYILLNNAFGSAGQGNRIFLYFFLGIFIAIPDVLYNLKRPLYRLGYCITVLVYGLGYWYIAMSSGSGEVVPYIWR